MEEKTLVRKLHYVDKLSEVVPGGVDLTELDKHKRKIIEGKINENPFLLRKFQHKTTFAEETEKLTSHCKGKGFYLPWSKDEKQMIEVEKMNELTGLDLGFQKKGISTSGPVIAGSIFTIIWIIATAPVLSMDFSSKESFILAVIFYVFFAAVVYFLIFLVVLLKRKNLNNRSEEAEYLDQEINRLYNL